MEAFQLSLEAFRVNVGGHLGNQIKKTNNAYRKVANVAQVVFFLKHEGKLPT